jgi:hypothetical protein
MAFDTFAIGLSVWATSFLAASTTAFFADFLKILSRKTFGN